MIWQYFQFEIGVIRIELKITLFRIRRYKSVLLKKGWKRKLIWQYFQFEIGVIRIELKITLFRIRRYKSVLLKKGWKRKLILQYFQFEIGVIRIQLNWSEIIWNKLEIAFFFSPATTDPAKLSRCKLVRFTQKNISLYSNKSGKVWILQMKLFRSTTVGMGGLETWSQPD